MGKDLLPFRPFPFRPLAISSSPNWSNPNPNLTLTPNPNPNPKWQEDEMGKDEMETYLGEHEIFPLSLAVSTCNEMHYITPIPSTHIRYFRCHSSMIYKKQL